MSIQDLSIQVCPKVTLVWPVKASVPRIDDGGVVVHHNASTMIIGAEAPPGSIGSSASATLPTTGVQYGSVVIT